VSPAMRCGRAQDLLPEFLGQGLDKATRSMVREHLRDCVQCRKVGSEWLQARKALRAAAVAADVAAAVPEESWSAWHADILRAVATAPVSTPRRMPALPRWVAGAVAAAALLSGLVLGARVDGGLLLRDPITAQPGQGQGTSLLRPLGQERWAPAPTANGLEWRRRWATHGLRGRALHTLEDEFLPNPVRVERDSKTPGTTGDGR